MARKKKADDEVMAKPIEGVEEKPVEDVESKPDDSEIHAAAEAYVLRYTRRTELNETLEKVVDELAAVAKERGAISFTGAPREIYDVLNTYRR